jgi:hypothetical protein
LKNVLRSFAEFWGGLFAGGLLGFAVFMSVGFLFEIADGPSLIDWQVHFLPFFALSLSLPSLGIWLIVRGRGKNLFGSAMLFASIAVILFLWDFVLAPPSAF